MKHYFNKLRFHKVNLAISLLIVLTGLVLVVMDPPPVQLIRLGYFDQLQVLKPRIRLSPEASPVVVVNIDEESMDAHGKWPWDRRQWAKVVKNLYEAGAAAIVFDIVFAEEGRTGGDPDLVAAIKNGRVVLAMGQYWRNADVPERQPLKKMIAIKKLRENAVDAQQYLPEIDFVLRNTPAIEKAAAGHGIYSSTFDLDGKMRVFPTILTHEGVMYPSLSLEAVRVATQKQFIVAGVNQAGVRGVILVDGIRVPTNAHGEIRLHYAHVAATSYIPAKNVVSGNFDPQKFKGKIAIIGTDAVGLGTQMATPINSAMQSIEIQAQLIESILSNQLLARPNYIKAVELITVFLMGVFLTLVMPVLTVRSGTVFVVLLSGLIVGTSWYLFASHRMLIDASLPLLIAIMLYAVNLILRSMRLEALAATTDNN
ncbi:MAG: CHASE2 domain-containing protein [Rhodospirillales bacterium]|nr:CHASE2 domain-containing protein [Rhodospirillales bacterium]